MGWKSKLQLCSHVIHINTRVLSPLQIKDAAERRRLDDRQLHMLATGASPTCVVLQPDLVFDYNSQ